MLARHSNKKMFKPLIAAVAAAPLFAGAAFAGPYVNVEANASYPDGEYTTATTDLHFGFDGATEDGRLLTTYKAALHSSTLNLLTTPRLNSLVRLELLLLLQTALTSTARSLVFLAKILVETTSLTSLVSLVLSTPSDHRLDNQNKGPFTGPFLCYNIVPEKYWLR